MEKLRPRWIVLTLILVIAAIALVLIWADDEMMRQFQVLKTMMTVGAAGVALLLWVGLMSGMRGRIRGIVIASVAVPLVLAGMLLRVEGVSGDFIPIFVWRWSPKPDEIVSVRTGAASATATALPGMADFPQFLGPTRTGHVEGVALERDWTAHPPQIVWRQRVGAGWSGFAIAGGRALTQEQRGDQELVVCYDAATGLQLWTHAETTRYETTLGGIGPRTTPTIDGDRVFTLGANGHLNALDLETGNRLWSVRLNARPEWGYSGSPLVDGGRVIVSPGESGASMTAYDRETGARVWAAGNAPAGYSSPAIASLFGARQILILNHTTVAAHDPATGTVLWETPWRGGNPKVVQPIPVGNDAVFVSSGYGIGCALLQLKRKPSGAITVERAYENLRMKAKFPNMILIGEYLYGLDDGILACLRVRTGNRLWKGGRYGHGQMIESDGLLVIQDEDGDLVLVEATPRGHRELARVPVFDSKTWNSPALAGCYLFVRNDREAACLKLPVREE